MILRKSVSLVGSICLAVLFSVALLALLVAATKIPVVGPLVPVYFWAVLLGLASMPVTLGGFVDRLSVPCVIAYMTIVLAGTTALAVSYYGPIARATGRLGHTRDLLLARAWDGDQMVLAPLAVGFFMLVCAVWAVTQAVRSNVKSSG